MRWAKEVLGATGDFDLLPTIGSKELVAWLPTFLEASTVNYPEVAYPTYLVGALIAGAEAHAVGLNPQNWQASDLSWINTPSNPTGRVHTVAELRAAIDFSRKTNTVLASDE